MKTVGIVGASLAGLQTARELRRQGHDGRLMLVGDEQHRPYDRPPLSKDFLAGKTGEADLALEAEGEDLGIEWRLGTTATGLDVAARRVELSDGTTLQADGLVIATGATARSLPGVAGLDGIHTLRTLDDARALRDDLSKARRLVVIGGGFIGAEVAATMRSLGLDVTLVTSGPVPLAEVLGRQMAEAIAARHEERGIRIIRGASVTGLTGTGRADGVLLADGRHLPADVVVIGIGVIPNTGWLRESGIELGDGVICDEGGATSAAGIVAVGDCAAWLDPASGRHHRAGHWTGARQQAAVAAVTLLSGGEVRPGPQRPTYFWSDQYDMRIQFSGRTQRMDSVSVEDGDVTGDGFLAVYRRDDRPVAVLGVNRLRLFSRRRRLLETEPVQVG
ncbi:MAG: ferredoxin reductase [Actinomycetia bacterium]|nr:ferredoxin reductase [Actinomycetes bacterium]